MFAIVTIPLTSSAHRDELDHAYTTTSHLSHLNHVPGLFAAVVTAVTFTFIATGCVGSYHRLVTLDNGEMSSAYRDLKARRYSLALVKYLLILQQEPSGPEAEESKFRLGECYFHMRSYLEAGAQFQRYLSDCPEGVFAADARQYLGKLQEIEQRERERERLRKEEIRKRLGHWREASRKEPTSAEAAAQVGHAFWDLEQYEEATQEYLRAINLEPDRRYGKLISQRLSFDEDGTVTVLTPEELARLERERNPIVVFNRHAYRGGGRDLFSSAPRWFIVTGQLVNRSSHTVRDVGVLVTILDFAGHVLDSADHRVGTVKPGQIRAFSVRFTKFENIYNIDRYECKPVFE